MLSPLRRLRMPAVAVLLVGGLLAAWALSIILTPPGAAAGPTGFTTVEVIEGEVGSRLALNVTAEWTPTPVGTNQAAGIVTGVEAQPGASVGQGTRLYSVDGRPVVVARGDMPAYRSIAAGSSGDDVRQLQALLADLALYSGPLDGTLGEDAASAVERWQASLGLPPTGEVVFGDIIFVPTLPERLTLRADVVKRGARLVGGEEVVLALGPSPVFSLPVGDTQSAQIPTGARVDITAPSGALWPAVVTARAPAPTGATVVLALQPPPPAPAPPAPAPSVASTPPASAPPVASTPPAYTLSATPPPPASAPFAASTPPTPAPSVAPPPPAPAPPATPPLPAAASVPNAPICGDACDSIPATSQTLLAASIVTLETVRGAVVPTIALQTDASQHLSLVDAEGNEHPVTVEAESRGMSVVTGVAPGLVVRIPETAATLDGGAGPG